jgi:antitoxin component of MazEF toxin-antitoxin module
MIKSLTRHGNSVALVLDRALLELVKIEPDQPVEISTDNGQRLIISPVRRDGSRAARVRKSLAEINAKHRKTLKKLSV